jgi:hypothetical protein
MGLATGPGQLRAAFADIGVQPAGRLVTQSSNRACRRASVSCASVVSPDAPGAGFPATW